MSEWLNDLRGLVPDQLIAQLATLPASLRLARIPYYRAGASVVAQKRGAFRITKIRFHQYLGEHYAGGLRAMGLGDTAITNMRFHGTPPENRPGERLDATIDHVLSLNFGGSNDFENLVLIPVRFNALKNELERLQLSDKAARSEVITIVPARAGDHVPFIEGRFQRNTLERAKALVP